MYKNLCMNHYYVHYFSAWGWLQHRTSTFVHGGVVSWLQIVKVSNVIRAILCKISLRNVKSTIIAA
jgi:hypothetical protein